MPLHRFRRQVKHAGDLLVGQCLRHQAQHIELAGTQHFRSVRIFGLFVARLGGAGNLEQPLGVERQYRVEHTLGQQCLKPGFNPRPGIQQAAHQPQAMPLTQCFDKVLPGLCVAVTALLADRHLQAHRHHASPPAVMLGNFDQRLQPLGGGAEIPDMQAPFTGSTAGDYLNFQGSALAVAMALGDLLDALQHPIGLLLIAHLLRPAHAQRQGDREQSVQFIARRVVLQALHPAPRFGLAACQPVRLGQGLHGLHHGIGNGHTLEQLHPALQQLAGRLEITLLV
ncbi:hypothetical protein D3C85_1039890 [compost metagenome]